MNGPAHPGGARSGHAGMAQGITLALVLAGLLPLDSPVEAVEWQGINRTATTTHCWIPSVNVLTNQPGETS